MPTQRVTISKRYCLTVLVICLVCMTTQYSILCSQVSVYANISSVLIGEEWIENKNTDVTAADIVGSLSGTIFLDEDLDGIQDPAEVGIPGISVTVFEGDNLVAQGISDADGTYLFEGLDEQVPYQIIFEGWEDVYQESTLGPDNAGSIQQAFADGTLVHLGLKLPDVSCDDPFIVVPCYVEGDLSISGTEPAILRLPSSADGHDFVGVNITPDYQAEEIATYDEVGTVYGLAWQATTRRYYAGAFHKRYTSFGPEGPDAIYQLDLAGNTTGVINLDDVTFVNDVAGSDVHDLSSTFGGSLLDIGVGNASFDGVGKRSLGDIEIDDDFSTLYVMNLFDRIIYALDVSTGVAGDAALINSWPSPDATAAGRHRPFGLAWHEDKLWIGSVDEDGSEAYVHSLDVQTGVFDLVLTIPLDYPRQAFLGNAGNINAPGAWNPWQSTPNFTPHEVDNEIAFPQAILSDIEFSEEGDMILGFRDRFGDQGGAEKFFNVGDPEETWVIAQGDILKVCLSTASPGQTDLYIELENLSNQVQFAPFQVITDASASHGQYIVWPDNSGPLLQVPTNTSSGQVSLDFTISEPADVEFGIIVDFPNGGDNSFWYRLDDGPWIVENSTTTDGWEEIIPTTFNNLAQGNHTLHISRREDGSLLDRLRLTPSSGTITSSLDVPSDLHIELEDLSSQGLFTPFQVINNASASHGQFIVWPNGSGPLVNIPTANTNGQVSVDFTTSESADIEFGITVDFPTGRDNSFWYRLDGGSWTLENSNVTNGWEELVPAIFTGVSAGVHTLDILRREDGSRLDKIRLTSSSGVISRNQTIAGETYVLESGNGGACAVQNSGLANSGPSGNEFYYWDLYALEGNIWNPGVPNGGFHWETTQGGLVQIPGSPYITTTAIDPFDDFSGGVINLDNTTGAREGVPLVGPVDPNNLIGGYTIYESGDFINGLPPANGFAAKANGLGDLEAACAASYGIGNYVWVDLDQDGRQDSDEPGLAGVLVELYEDGVLIGQDTTDQNGHYFFGGPSNHGLNDGVLLSSGVNYQLRISLESIINNSTGIADISGVTQPNFTDDRLDSDAQSNDTIAFIDVILSIDQITDYTFDFGFSVCGVSQVSYLNDTSVCQGELLVLTADIMGDSLTDHLWTTLSSTTSTGFFISSVTESELTIDAENATTGIITLAHSAMADGCPVADSIDVVILERPIIEVTSSIDSTCTGEEVTLTAATIEYDISPQGGSIPPSNGTGFSQEHTLLDVLDPAATLITITLPTWDDHFAETTLNGQVLFPEVPQPDSWNAGGMDTDRPWLPNVNGLPRSIIEITETSIRYFRTETTTSTALEEVFPTNWVSTPQPFIAGDNTLEFGILNTAGPVSGSWTVEATAIVGYDFLWSTGDTTQDITVSPMEITEYMVTVTNPQNCSAEGSRTIFAGTNNIESITYSGCSGDGYEVLVNGTIYNEANPTDTVVVNTASGCDSTFFINLVYDIPPMVNAGSLPSPLCSNSILLLDDLTASITGGATQGIWTSTGDGTFDNGGLFGGANPATTYTPSETEISAGKVILTLTSDDPPGSCEPEADAVMIIINDVRCNTFPWSGG